MEIIGTTTLEVEVSCDCSQQIVATHKDIKFKSVRNHIGGGIYEHDTLHYVFCPNCQKEIIIPYRFLPDFIKSGKVKISFCEEQTG